MGLDPVVLFFIFGLLAGLVATRDAGLRTIPQGDTFVGTCSMAEAQTAGLLWIALVAVAREVLDTKTFTPSQAK